MNYQNLHTSPFNEANLANENLCIQEMNKRFAFTVWGSKPRVIDELYPENPALSKEAFFAMFANRKIKIGETTKPVAEYWWHHQNRRQYLGGVTFDPSNSNGADQLNLWRGFNINPDPTASCERLLWHIENIICGGDTESSTYLLNWLALMIQKPVVLPGTAICLLSVPGTGKGLMMQYLGKLLGTHYLPVTDLKDLTGRFTACLERAVLVFADELVWTSDKTSRSLLKTLITEPDRMIEKKGIDSYKAKNCTHLIFASNDQKAIPAELGDRRYFVPPVSDQKVGDRTYFSDLAAEMSNGGPNALLHYLQGRDISLFDPSQFPSSELRTDQLIHSLEPIDRWWFESLVSAPEPRKIGENVLPKEDVYEIYAAWHRGNLKCTPGSITDVTKTLRKYGVKDSRPRTDSRRTRCYVIPDLLTARSQFESIINDRIDWKNC